MPKKQMTKMSGINNNDFICFDFETGGKSPHTCAPIQVAAIAINARKLTPYPGAEFKSMMRPPGPEEEWNIEPEALEINKKTMDEIRAAPGEEQVWREFAAFVNKYNPKGKAWTAPIPAGQNIKGYDLIIAHRLCDKYKMDWMFNSANQADLMDLTFFWFENQAEPENRKLDTLRKFFGMETEGAHDAMVDVQQTWHLINKFMNLHRRLAPSINWKGKKKDGEHS